MKGITCAQDRSGVTGTFPTPCAKKCSRTGDKLGRRCDPMWSDSESSVRLAACRPPLSKYSSVYDEKRAEILNNMRH